jgi:hypothetical protein
MPSQPTPARLQQLFPSLAVVTDVTEPEAEVLPAPRRPRRPRRPTTGALPTSNAPHHRVGIGECDARLVEPDEFIASTPSTRQDTTLLNGWRAYTRSGTWQQTIQRAQERGATIEPANPQLLQIDIDSPEAYERFNELIEMWENIPQLPRLGRVLVRTSRTPGHKHITIELPRRYRVMTRILMQALLGSDLRREMLSYASHRNQHPQPIVLFRQRL